MLIKLDIFLNINRIMQFKIFNHSQCKRVKFLLLNKLHLTQLNQVEMHAEQELVVEQLNLKKEREVVGEIITMDLDQIQKEET